MGRLTRDPELRYTPSSVAVCTITLAVERDYAAQDGKRECDAEKWTFFGLSRKNKTKINWVRVIAVGGDEQITDLVLLIAMMTSRARDLARDIVNAVPQLNEETLSELVEAAMETLDEVDEDA